MFYYKCAECHSKGLSTKAVATRKKQKLAEEEKSGNSRKRPRPAEDDEDPLITSFHSAIASAKKLLPPPYYTNIYVGCSSRNILKAISTVDSEFYHDSQNMTELAMDIVHNT